MAHVAESQHWYTRSGEACYEVPDATGKRMITPDLRHARKFGLLPGVSSLEKILAAPGLEAWKRRQAVMAALTLSRLPDETDDAFLARVEEDGRAYAKKRADEGKAMHQAIEECLKGRSFTSDTWAVQARAVKQFLEVLTGKSTVWECERTFAHQSGYGGRVDALCSTHIVDFKSRETLLTKEGTEMQDRDLFYDEHIRQLALYNQGVGDDPQHRACVSLIISTTQPGLLRHHIWNPEDEQRGLDMGMHCLALWKLRNKYESGWTG